MCCFSSHVQSNQVHYWPHRFTDTISLAFFGYTELYISVMQLDLRNGLEFRSARYQCKECDTRSAEVHYQCNAIVICEIPSASRRLVSAIVMTTAICSYISTVLVPMLERKLSFLIMEMRNFRKLSFWGD